MLLNFLTERFDVDERAILWEFSLPWLGRFGFVGCDLEFWAISFVLLSAEMFLNCAFAIVIYKFIIPHERKMGAFLLGYGVIVPMILASPFLLLEWIPVKNMAFLLCFVGGTATLIFFRCIEAMHGTLPAFAKTSMGSFMLYYASALQFSLDEKTGEAVKATRQDLIRKLIAFVGVFVKTSVLHSILMPVGYKLFQKSSSTQGLADLFHWGNLVDNFLMASLTGLVLESGGLGLGILTSFLSGLKVTDFMDNPFTQSESPSDFWSRRWNKITQSGLRRGVYLPLMQSGLSRSASSLGTFLASGILHEYVLVIMKQRRGIPNNPTHTAFEPNYGNHLRFFAWCGLVLWIEKLTKKTAPVIWMQKHLPRPIRTGLVLLTVLPIAHLFTDEYVASSFYNDLALGFVKIEYLGGHSSI